HYSELYGNEGSQNSSQGPARHSAGIPTATDPDRQNGGERHQEMEEIEALNVLVDERYGAGGRRPKKQQGTITFAIANAGHSERAHQADGVDQQQHDLDVTEPPGIGRQAEHEQIPLPDLRTQPFEVVPGRQAVGSIASKL